VLSSGEGLDDEHRGAAVSAHEGGPDAVVVGATVTRLSGKGWRWLMQKLASGGDVELAVGEKAVVADAMKARGHVRICFASRGIRLWSCKKTAARSISSARKEN
jgi:hypothetical protein